MAHPRMPRVSCICLFLATLVFASRGRAQDIIEPPLEKDVADRAELQPTARNALKQVMQDKFGGPGTPKVWDALPVDYGAAEQGKEPGWKLRAGQELYARKCAACHGELGDGGGPKAAGLDPTPRDFRFGWFKWKSTSRGDDHHGPLRHDLRETLRLGIPGTAMPAFPEFEPAEAEALIEYVRWLAMRGEFEYMVAGQLQEPRNAAEVEAMIAQGFDIESESVSESWRQAAREESILRVKQKRPEPMATSIARGKTLFSGRLGCNKCHGADGKGVDFRMRDYWGNMTTAWDLTAEPYRGGAAPEDFVPPVTGRHGGVRNACLPRGASIERGRMAPGELCAVDLASRAARQASAATPSAAGSEG